MREFELIEYIQRACRSLTLPQEDRGIGDDACVWTPKGRSCLSVDAIIEGKHFTSNDDPRLIGRKAAAAALSDIAAMGARVRGAALVYYMADGWDHTVVIDGFVDELKRHDCPLYGGDTVSASALSLSVTVWGERSERMLMRSGAMVGDLLVVTGALGGSLLSGRHLRPSPRIYEGQWLAQQAGVHAMMDVSDGIASDLRKMCAASDCGCLLYADKIPVHKDVPAGVDRIQSACCDGEDFELLLAIDATAWSEIIRNWPFDVPLTIIGSVNDDKQVLFEDMEGRIISLPWSGFEHSS